MPSSPPRDAVGNYSDRIAHIGTLNESSLHAELKDLFALPGDEFEVELGGFVIDIRRGDTLIEIQTTTFAAMGRKLDHLLASYQMLIVHPIAVHTYLHRLTAEHDGDGDGDTASVRSKGRRSPKRNDLYCLFEELVSMPTVLDHPNLALEVVLADVDKLQRHDPSLRRRRGGWRTVDRRLRTIHSRHRFDTVDDLNALIPAGLPTAFTTADLAKATGTTRAKAQKMAYCFRATGAFRVIDRSRAGMRYTLG